MSDACVWVTDRLPEYRGGRLDADERRRLEEHLAACAACAAENRLLSALRRVAAPPPPAERWDRLVDEVAGRALARVRRSRWVRGPGLLRAAAIVVAIAGLSALWWARSGREPEGPWAQEPTPAAWEALEGMSGAPWSESALSGWFTLDDLNVAELERLLEEVGTT